MTNPTELLTCPFCGGEAKLVEYTGNGFIEPRVVYGKVTCLVCKFETPAQQPREGFIGDYDHSRVVAAWNTRAAPAPVASDVERAIHAVAQIEMDREGYPLSRSQEEIYGDAGETVDAVIAAFSLTTPARAVSREEVIRECAQVAADELENRRAEQKRDLFCNHLRGQINAADRIRANILALIGGE